MTLPRGAAALLLLAVSAFAQPNTTQPAPQTPGLRSQPSLLYDEARKKILLVDGTYPAVQPEFTEIWSWDGTRWELIPASGPAGRYSSAAVYDKARQRIITYGGRVGKPEQIKGDLWEFGGGKWSLASEQGGPGPRDHHSLAYDSARRKTILFGGGKFPRTSPWATDTWEWDGAAWTQAASTGPVGRVTVMVYDNKRKQTVLFGGVGEAPGAGQPQPNFNDTWTWDAKAWRNLGVPGPPARDRHAMTFDSDAGVVLLYGGRTPTESFGDLWQWDGSAWTEIQMTGPTPGKRALHSMAYDPSRRRTVLYGGNASGAVVGDTWEWDGKRWSKVN